MNLITAALLVSLYTYGNADGGHAVTQGLIAWSDGAHIRTGALGSHGAMRSAVSIEVGTPVPHMALASDGESFLLAFIERHPTLGDLLAIVPLDARGHATRAVQLLGPANDAAPELSWNGTSYFVSDAQTRYEIDRTGAVVARNPAPRGYHFYKYAGGELHWITSSLQALYHCSYFSGCRWYPPSWSTSWTFIGPSATLDGYVSGEWYSNVSPIAASSGTDAILAWNGANAVSTLLIHEGDDRRVAIPGMSDFTTTPAAASDGKRFLVAFDTYSDIYAAFLDDTTYVGNRFPVATAGERESEPRVAALREGRFLVTYKRDGKLHGQVVTAGEEEAAGRRRAVR